MACGPQQQWYGQTEEPSRLAETNVRYWHIADVPLVLTNVCFKGKNGHDAGVTPFPLMAHSGHSCSE
jgi:hypothetical protein